jgi:SHS2 domain-containing protein
VNSFDVKIQSGTATLLCRGKTHEELFINAARALASCLVDPSTVERGGFRDRIQVRATGLEPLLAAWMDQIHFLMAAQQEALCHFEIHSLTETGIDGEGEGELFDPGRHRRLGALDGFDRKRIDIRETPEGFEAEAVFYKS